MYPHFEPKFHEMFSAFASTVERENSQNGLTVYVADVFEDLIRENDPDSYPITLDAVDLLIQALAKKNGWEISQIESEYAHMIQDAATLYSEKALALAIIRLQKTDEDSYFDELDNAILRIESTAIVYSGTPLDMWLELEEEKKCKLYMRLFEFTDDD